MDLPIKHEAFAGRGLALRTAGFFKGPRRNPPQDQWSRPRSEGPDRGPSDRARPAARLVRIRVDGDPHCPCLRRRWPGCTTWPCRGLLERPDFSKRSWHGRQVRSKRADFAGSSPSVLFRRSCPPAPYRPTREGLTPNTRLELRRPAVMVEFHS